MTSTVLKRIQRGLFIAALPIAMGFGVHAQQVDQGVPHVKDVGGAERVNYSGKLRMLSQRIVATSCNFSAGVDPEKSGAFMHATKAEFKLIVDALEFGNDDLGVYGAEERKKTIRTVRKLREAFALIEGQIDAINHTEDTSQSLTSLAKDSVTLLEETKLLVSILTAQYANQAAMVHADAILVDLSGRQRMLTQRMSKNICLIASGIEVETAMDELATTAKVFEASLNALRGGNQDVGIRPPANAQIEDGLSVVLENWLSLKPSVEATLAGKTLDAAERATVYHGMNQMTVNMSTVVGHYASASKTVGM